MTEQPHPGSCRPPPAPHPDSCRPPPAPHPGDDDALPTGPQAGPAPADDIIDVRVVDDGRPVVKVRGEIDLSTRDRLRSGIEQALAMGDQVVIDLTETTFMDSSGLATLMRVRHERGDDDTVIVLRQPSPSVRSVLEITGVDQILTIE